jgi:hypothetical protein
MKGERGIPNRRFRSLARSRIENEEVDRAAFHFLIADDRPGMTVVLHQHNFVKHKAVEHGDYIPVRL